MTTLWLVRHARPLIDTERCYGRLDIQADDEATQSAALRLQQALRPHLGQCRIFHSPLQRCEQLAQALIELQPDFTSDADKRLLEVDFGHWEGQRWDAIGEAAISAWARNLAEHAPGDGESLVQMLGRVGTALQDAKALNAEHVVWISHAGVARCAQWLLQHGSRLPQSHEWTLPAPAYGQFIQLSL